MCARIRILSSYGFVACATLVGLVAQAGADSSDASRWWIEVVREREVPAAIAAARAEARKAAELKEREDEEEAKEAAAGEKVPIRERVRAMLEKLPKAKPEGEGEKPGDPGDDAAAGDGDAAKEEAAAEAADAAAGGAGAEDATAEADPAHEVLTVTVAMAGQVVSLDNEHLQFRPTVRPEEVLKLPLKQVTSLSRHAPGRTPDNEEPPDLEFRVVLRDGSEVPGQLMRLSDKAITVALVGSGARIDLPLTEITRVERNEPVGEASEGTLPEVPGRHIAALSTGEIVAGQLLPSRDSDKWLRISSPILTAEAPLSLIDLLVFPDPEAAAGEAEVALADEVIEEDDGNNAAPEAVQEPPPVVEPELDEDVDIRHLVSLSPAGMLWAKNLQLDGENLLISALGKDAFAVPLDRVESVSFGHEGLGSTAPVLIWGGFSDEDDEYRKTIDALDNRVPARRLLQNTSKVPDAEFMRQLRRSRVLLVPEMESFKKADLDAAKAKGGKAVPSWRDAFRGFLRRGGNIVFLSPTGEALNFFNESGLGPLRSGGGGSGWEFTAEGKKLGAKVGGKVTNVNATHYYRKAAPWQVWGQAKDGGDGVPLIGRRMERGWVMVFGTDFYETNEDVTETLVRLLEFRGRR